MSLKDILCQDRAIGILQQALAADRLPHAYIFAGAEGVGKLATAKRWAKLLLCQNRKATRTGNAKFYDSCQICQSCTLFDAGSHPDFTLIYKELLEYTANNKNKTTPVFLSIDVIREFLIDKISSRPQLSEARVFVVCEADKMKDPAQNALLKVLEEPASRSFIILLCTRLDKMLPTILSRCQLVRFGPVAEDKIVERLGEAGVDETESLFWARFTYGSLGLAEKWTGLRIGQQSFYNVKRELIDRLVRCRLADVVEFAEWILAQSRQLADQWLKNSGQVSKPDIKRRVHKELVRMVMTAFDDAMKLNVALADKLINSDQRKDIESLAKRFDAEQSAQRISQAYKSITWIEASVNEKLVFEELLLKCVDSGIMPVTTRPG